MQVSKAWTREQEAVVEEERRREEGGHPACVEAGRVVVFVLWCGVGWPARGRGERA